ncbi:hypothetical protein [Cardinium endosymbiont of Sogatella furcifera]|uniref:hypothetical protein n=1 Tax=Cardinium endosymbiont of Sogatella furcifera TaxID=650378 RepID=UPI000E0D0277|nr:hypothetical protein [Cardinium endosymbiont of Sogatella furcifera]
MLAYIRMTSIFLLCCILQSGCPTKCSEHQSSVGIGQLSDAASYAQTLDPSVKAQIFAFLKNDLFYKRYLGRIGAPRDLLPEQLSLAQKEEWEQVYLLFVDLYRIICKVVEHFELQEAPGSLDDPRVAIMEALFMKDVNPLEGPETKALVLSFKRLWATIQQHYMAPFDRYINGGDHETLKKSIHNGRKATYLALVDFCKAVVNSEPEDAAEKGDGA